MSAGGVLGGLFAALFAPLIFDWVYEHPLLILAAAMLIPLPALLPWDKWLGLEAKTVRAVTVLLVVIAAFASWHMVEQWTGRLDGTVAGWGVAIFVVGMLDRKSTRLNSRH